jgi:enoyl-CoA hydratase/carnithine racemase
VEGTLIPKRLADSANIQHDVSDHILTVTLNRPEKRNALTREMVTGLTDAIAWANGNDDIRVVIVTGAGTVFCAGADIESLRAGPAGDPARPDLVITIYESFKPVIAAINGPAFGMGITMTLPMDIRIASTGDDLGFVFTRRGLVPEAGSTWFLPRIVGISTSLKWTLTGSTVTASEAAAAGLVADVVAPDALMKRTREIAMTIAQDCAPVATAMTRRLQWQMLEAPSPRDTRALDRSLNDELRKGPDVAEGISAYREGRRPAFPGKVSTDLPESFQWRGATRRGPTARPE